MKKNRSLPITAVLFVLCCVFAFSGCSKTADIDPMDDSFWISFGNTENTTATPSSTSTSNSNPTAGNNTQATSSNMKPTETELKIPTSAPADKTAEIRDVSADFPLAESVIYANNMANAVQGYYTSNNRQNFKMTNAENSITTFLGGQQGGLSTLNDKNGKTFFEKTLDVFAEDKDGKINSMSSSSDKGRVNITKMGYYYYDTNIRDYKLGFDGQAKTDTAFSVTMDASKWTTHDGSVSNTKEGEIEFTVSNSHDPYFFIKNLSVPADTHNAVQITMKNEGESVSGRLYYCAGSNSGFSESQSGSFSLINDGAYHTYTIALPGATGSIRDIRFDMGSATNEKFYVKAVNFALLENPTLDLYAEKTFHTYSDKLHFEASLVNNNSVANTNIKAYGFRIKIPADKITKAEIMSATGKQSFSSKQLSGKSVSNAYYIALGIKDSGNLGIILGNKGKEYKVSCSSAGNDILISVYFDGISKIDSKKAVSIGCRIVTDTSSDFSGIEKICNQERNPFSDITASGSNSKFLSYNADEGAYSFKISGTGFNEAYKKANNYFMSNISIKASEKRNIYISFKGSSGCLEGACVTDEKGTFLPLPVEVCKNFCGEKEEPIYEPADLEYGYSVFPLSLSAGQNAELRLYNVYQNWGKMPIKQLSSISFINPYYHLSTGTTESNCIGPYYIFGRDGWTLPDFRGCSGKMWSNQPQFNSVGRLYFMYTRNASDNRYYSEYYGADIHSSGLSYADIDYKYISYDGDFNYSLRHVEMPQTDENRTYYTISVNFLKDVTYSDFKNQFRFFTFDGRNVVFKNGAYSDASGKIKEISQLNSNHSKLYELGGESPFFTYYNYSKIDDSSGENFALIVTDSKIISDGKEWKGNFAFSDEYSNKLNIGSLTLNVGAMSFKKGDTITIQLVLLPYGVEDQNNYNNVNKVIEDSKTHKFSISSNDGAVGKDYYIPSVEAKNNEVSFTVSGGRNNNAVKVTGFTKLCVPTVYEQIDGKWVLYDYHKVDGTDGYSVSCEYGKYSYSFVIDMGDVTTNKRTFRVIAE